MFSEPSAFRFLELRIFLLEKSLQNSGVYWIRAGMDVATNVKAKCMLLLNT